MKFFQLFNFGLALLCTFMVGCNQNSNNQNKLEKSLPTTKLNPQTIRMPHTYVADIQGIQLVEVKPKIEGYIEEIYVDEGQKVNKGDRLFRLSSHEFSENVKESEANLKQAEAEYQMAKYEESRIDRLVKKNIISKIRLEQANSEVAVAKLKVEQAKAQLQRSHVNYNYTVISAPYSGYIDRIPYKKGSLVNTESLLTSISDASEIFAYYNMNESDYLTYKRDQLSGESTLQKDSIDLILSDGSLYEYKGQVETVESVFERGTGSISFRARFPNPEGLLKHGGTGKIVMTTEMANIYLIPQQSTFEILEFTYVYIVNKDGVAKIRSFEPMERYKNFYVAEDFEPGTEIIYSGIQSVRDGMKVISEELSFEQIEKETHKEDLDTIN